MNELPSSLLENAVKQFATLPGVGRHSALRFALHMLRRSDKEVSDFLSAISSLKADIHYCKHCFSISDTEVCPICSNPKRDPATICVVENIQEVMAIENTQQYRGLYHVLGGVISPIDGIGVNDLTINQLIERISQNSVSEVILALPTTMEGDTTNFYINKLLRQFPNVAVTTLARGVAIGDNLEYADEITLGRSILHRIPFETLH